MAFSLAAKISLWPVLGPQASLVLQRTNVYKTAAVGARVHRKLSSRGAGGNLLLSARTSTITLSAPPKALLVSYATVGRDGGLDGGCSLSSSRIRFLLRSEKRLDPLKSCPILQHIAAPRVRKAAVHSRDRSTNARAAVLHSQHGSDADSSSSCGAACGISPPCRLPRRPPACARWPDAVLRTAGSSRLARGAEAEWL